MNLNILQEKLLLQLECFVTYKVTIAEETHNIQLYGGLIDLDKGFLVKSEESGVFPTDPEQSYHFRKYD